jgi:hypothetical protein
LQTLGQHIPKAIIA